MWPTGALLSGLREATAIAAKASHPNHTWQKTFIFKASDFDDGQILEVLEVDGSWRECTVFKAKKPESDR